MNVSDIEKKKFINYLSGFNPTHLYTVLQILTRYQCCEEIIEPIQQYLQDQINEIAKIKRRARQQFERAGMPLVTDEEREVYRRAPCLDEETADHRVMEPGQLEHEIIHERIQEPQTLNVVVGFCPKCNSPMVGNPIPPCESDESGRHFYAECTTCSFYKEIFKGRKERYTEKTNG